MAKAITASKIKLVKPPDQMCQKLMTSPWAGNSGRDLWPAIADHGFARAMERGRCLHAKFECRGGHVPVHLYDEVPH